MRKLDAFLVELLRQIPASADPGDSEAARERLYSKPGDDPAANREWIEYVAPGLRSAFESATETVQRDLLALAETDPENAEPQRLLIPTAHFESWLNCLNQARLALAARNAFTDQELAARAPSFATRRDIQLFQVHFYGIIQECLLGELDENASEK